MNFEDGSRRLLLEEAYGLALLGRLQAAERLLDTLERGGVEDSSLRLCRARITLALAEPDRCREARLELERVLAHDGSDAWRSALDLARVASAEGRVTDAANLLKLSIDRLRDVCPKDAQDLLVALISDEVAALDATSAGALPAAARGADPDAALLLRLVEVGKRLASEADPERVLGVVLHEAIGITGTERGFVVLVSGEELEFVLAENLDRTEVERPSFAISRTLVRRVIEHGRALMLVLPELPDSGTAQGSLGELGVRAVACVPIRHAGATLGVLYLDGSQVPPAFGAPLERVLDLLGVQAGAALENARTHQKSAQALAAAIARLRRDGEPSRRRTNYGQLVGSSSAMQTVYERLDLTVPTEMPVLILGETGTGKELAARLIHDRGPRAGRRLLATNCAGIAESLLETELFGHERGAFTGAERSRAGMFELADGGTLFLDEIGDMGPRMQADLLRVLQSGEVRRVGSSKTFHVDVRVIAATHRDLSAMQRRGEFRQDLYYRLAVLTLDLPPLRERAEDVPLLVAEMMARFNASGERKPPRVSRPAMARLVAYAWPGNVRELENIVRRMIVTGADPIEERNLPPEVLRPVLAPGRVGSLRNAEDDAVRHALAAAQGNKAAAARILGVDRKTLYAKLRRLGAGSESSLS